MPAALAWRSQRHALSHRESLLRSEAILEAREDRTGRIGEPIVSGEEGGKSEVGRAHASIEAKTARAVKPLLNVLSVPLAFRFSLVHGRVEILVPSSARPCPS